MELGPLVTQIDWLSGFRQRVTNPRGFATTTEYQAYASPSTAHPVVIAEPAGVTTTIARNVHDARGNALRLSVVGALRAVPKVNDLIANAAHQGHQCSPGTDARARTENEA